MWLSDVKSGYCHSVHVQYLTASDSTLGSLSNSESGDPVAYIA